MVFTIHTEKQHYARRRDAGGTTSLALLLSPSWYYSEVSVRLGAVWGNLSMRGLLCGENTLVQVLFFVWTTPRSVTHTTSPCLRRLGASGVSCFGEGKSEKQQTWYEKTHFCRNGFNSVKPDGGKRFQQWKRHRRAARLATHGGSHRAHHPGGCRDHLGDHCR